MNINLTLFGQIIAFSIFTFLCMKLAWRPIITALRERQEKIAEGLAAAERGEHEKELADQRAAEVLKEAKTEAASILAQAQKQGGQLVEEAKATANNERERIIESGHEEIQQEINRAKESLRAEVSGIALAAAERILAKEVDAKTHKDVLDDLVSQI